MPTHATTVADLERQRADLLRDVGAWPAADVAFRPAPGVWSAAEVLDHLVRTERGILEDAVQGLAAPHPISVRDRVGSWFIDRVFRSDRRVRVPQPALARVGPDPAADLARAAGEWEAVRGDLARFLAPITPGQLRGGVFRHPVAGWMNVPQVLRFFWVHAHHHGFQLARLRAGAAAARSGAPA